MRRSTAGDLAWHRAADGARLCIHRWPATGRLRGHVLIVHGYADHAGRYAELAHHLSSQGFAMLAPDLRGHGRSDGRHGYIRRFEEYHADLATGLALLPATEPRFVIAHSAGALVALNYMAGAAEDAAPSALQGVVVTSPFLALAMSQPAAKLALGRLAARVYPRLTMPSGLAPELLIRDAAMVEARRSASLVFRTATAGWFAATERAQRRVRQLRHFPTRLLYIYSASDPVASPVANAQLADQLAGPATRVIVRPDDRHEVLHEIQRGELFARILGFIKEASATR